MRRLLVLCLVAGCDLYWGGGHSDDICAVEKTPVQPQVRDPSSGACITDGPPYGGGGGNCECEPCPDQGGSGSGAYEPDWPLCNGPCDSLTEDACQATTGCHAAYETDLGDDTGTRNFIGCWDLSITQSTGTCTGLDAYTCAEHDNCASLLDRTAQGGLAFDQCLDETKFCLQSSDCGAGDSCDTTVCHSLPCNPGPEGGACAEPCWGVCTQTPPPSCESLTTEQACTARGDCEAVYVGQNCTCDSSGNCTCESETYDHCESVPLGL